MQVIIALASLTAFLMAYHWLPETIHPGLAGYDRANPAGHLGTDEDELERRKTKRRFVFLNPLKSLMMLKSPVLLISIWTYSVLIRIR